MCDKMKHSYNITIHNQKGYIEGYITPNTAKYCVLSSNRVHSALTSSHIKSNISVQTQPEHKSVVVKPANQTSGNINLQNLNPDHIETILVQHLRTCKNH